MALGTGGKVVTPTHRPPLPPGISWYSFLEAESTWTCTMLRKKSPVTRPGVDPETFRLAGPYIYIYMTDIIFRASIMFIQCLRAIQVIIFSLDALDPIFFRSNYTTTYEGWNFNFGNAAVTFDTAYLQSSYFHRPSMYIPKLCRKRSQR